MLFYLCHYLLIFINLNISCPEIYHLRIINDFCCKSLVEQEGIVASFALELIEDALGKVIVTKKRSSSFNHHQHSTGRIRALFSCPTMESRRRRCSYFSQASITFLIWKHGQCYKDGIEHSLGNGGKA
mmetsp:Transcript_17615/g.28684  ORF Transcript_17615/g.28684 Transcript_17615/m.28684 type:complete len:128 (-) Transcript_17615:1058-1441(-)